MTVAVGVRVIIRAYKPRQSTIDNGMVEDFLNIGDSGN